MAFVAVEVSVVGSKPPAADVVRTSKGKRQDLGAAATLLTRTSSLRGRAKGWAFTPELVKLVFGPGSTRLAEKLSHASLVLL